MLWLALGPLIAWIMFQKIKDKETRERANLEQRQRLALLHREENP